jgi:hypothetical protein
MVVKAHNKKPPTFLRSLKDFCRVISDDCSLNQNMKGWRQIVKRCCDCNTSFVCSTAQRDETQSINNLRQWFRNFWYSRHTLTALAVSFMAYPSCNTEQTSVTARLRLHNVISCTKTLNYDTAGRLCKFYVTHVLNLWSLVVIGRMFPRNGTTVNTTCAHKGRYLLFAAHCQHNACRRGAGGALSWSLPDHYHRQ